MRLHPESTLNGAETKKVVSMRLGDTYIGTKHATSGVEDAFDTDAGTDRATSQRAEVLLKIFLIQSDPWGLFGGKESAARCLY